MPSNMVSQGTENSALPLPAATPLLAVSAIPQSALFPIAKWPEIAVVDGIMGALDGPVPRIGRGAWNAAALVALVL